MATLSLRTNLLLVCAAFLGMIATLQLPWFAASYRQRGLGPVGILDGLAREFSGTGISGFAAFGLTDRVFIGLTAIALLAAAAGANKSSERLARRLLILVPVVTIGLILGCMWDRAGHRSQLDLRYGPWIALLLALFSLSAALAVARKPLVGRTQRGPTISGLTAGPPPSRPPPR